jgi:hypothetical protein
MSFKIGKHYYQKNNYGMITQVNPSGFSYDKQYASHTKTNHKMSYLRIGVLLGFIHVDELKKMNCIELGPGNGEFYKTIQTKVNDMKGYDLADTEFSNITLPQIYNKQWDILFAFDVIEHMEDINDIWKIDFNYAFISIPCPPQGNLEDWRHLKPNEHLWHITASQFEKWANDNNYSVIYSGCPEDVIRIRWNKDKVNINTFIIKRRG